MSRVTKLKRQPGKDLAVIGSASGSRALMRHDLVDEYQLMIHPILISGKRLFEALRGERTSSSSLPGPHSPAW